MVTQLVMVSTVVLLFISGISFFKRGIRFNFPSVRIFAIGLFIISIAILLYSLRDILIQLKLYEIQKNFLIVGGMLHIIGAYLILWFLTKEFGPKNYFRYVYYVLFAVLLIGFGLFLTGKFFKLGSEIQETPLEPINYTSWGEYYVIRNYLQDPYGNLILWSVVVLISLLVILIINFNLLKEKRNKLALQKGLLYGFGIWFLIAPMIICATLSPIYARLGYFTGAILIYKALKKKSSFKTESQKA